MKKKMILTVVLTLFYAASAFPMSHAAEENYDTSDEIICSSEEEIEHAFQSMTIDDYQAQPDSLLLSLPEEIQRMIFWYIAAPTFTYKDWTDKKGRYDPGKLAKIIEEKLQNPLLEIMKNLHSCACACKQMRSLSRYAYNKHIPLRLVYYTIILASSLRHALQIHDISLFDTVDPYGWSMLHMIVRDGSIDAINLIFECARPESDKLLWGQKNGFAVVHEVALCGKAGAILLLLEYAGAKSDELLFSKMTHVNFTVLHCAALNGNINTMRALLRSVGKDAGKLLMMKDIHGMTALENSKIIDHHGSKKSEPFLQAAVDAFGIDENNDRLLAFLGNDTLSWEGDPS